MAEQVFNGEVGNWIRLAETIKPKRAARVVGITVRPVVADCEGAVWFTDLHCQDGESVSGYAVSTAEMGAIPGSRRRD
ncbi:MAG: hypothetical protein FWG25_10165 [Promicromonosporaceae bacterium]|nr:hypothetical protein [Promicromonosporaceae bacterium]